MGHPHYKELIFKSLQYLFIIKKPEKHKTITPNSGRPKKEKYTQYNLLISRS